MRRRIIEIIEVGKEEDRISRIYDFIMMFVIISILPLTIHTENQFTSIADTVTVSVFIIDYLFRLITADYR